MSSIDLASPDKKSIQQFFDAIAFRYDFLNQFLSFRLDDSWRNRSRDLILDGTEKSILDLGVGTGKFLKSFLTVQSWNQAVGLDFSEEMLETSRKTLSPFVDLVQADFHDLPFQKENFDVVISAFTLRSVKDMPRFLSEVHRVLTPNGKAGFLCLTRPRQSWFKLLYYPYLKFYLPFMGGLISGRRDAYEFLSQSIQTFQETETTAEIMRVLGFRDIEIHSFTFGVATLLVGKK